jgi:hypothetical protein
VQGETASLKPNQSRTFHLESELKAAPIPGKRRFMMAKDTLRFKTKSGEVIEYIDKSKDSPAKSKVVE